MASQGAEECFGRSYTQKLQCGLCDRFAECGEEWGERSRRPRRYARTYGHVGSTSPSWDNAVKVNEESR